MRESEINARCDRLRDLVAGANPVGRVPPSGRGNLLLIPSPALTESLGILSKFDVAWHIDAVKESLVFVEGELRDWFTGVRWKDDRERESEELYSDIERLRFAMRRYERARA